MKMTFLKNKIHHLEKLLLETKLQLLEEVIPSRQMNWIQMKLRNKLVLELRSIQNPDF